MEIRVLTETDRAAAEAFLVEHTDTSMFLRSNLRRAGLGYTGQVYSCVYIAAFEGQRLTGIVGHSWNGMLLIQAPAHVLDAQLGEGHAWVALADAQLCSLSAFNAVLPEIVQLGGVYTPPELRGRGYAKYAIAAQLAAARARGVLRATLFTDNPSAIRTYDALGFRRSGAFSMRYLR